MSHIFQFTCCWNNLLNLYREPKRAKKIGFLVWAKFGCEMASKRCLLRIAWVHRRVQRRIQFLVFDCWISRCSYPFGNALSVLQNRCGTFAESRVSCRVYIFPNFDCYVVCGPALKTSHFWGCLACTSPALCWAMTVLLSYKRCILGHPALSWRRHLE